MTYEDALIRRHTLLGDARMLKAKLSISVQCEGVGVHALLSRPRSHNEE